MSSEPQPRLVVRQRFRGAVEYHYRLQQVLGERRDAEAEKLLKLSDDDPVFGNGTQYTTDPARLLQRREAIARAIERLRR